MRNENRFFTLRRRAGFLAMAIGASILAASCEVEARRLPTFTIDFCLNGGEGTTPAAYTVGIGSAVVIPGHYGIYKSGNIFAGWGTAADGNGNRVDAGAEIVPTGDTTLYAQWLPGFTVVFDANGADGSAPDTRFVEAGDDMAIPGPGTLARGTFHFAGWDTQTDGRGTRFAAETEIAPTGDMTLFAIWVGTVAFNTNNADAGAAPQTWIAYADARLPLYDGGGLSRSGFAFGGWNTRSDGQGTNFAAGATIDHPGNVTLFARWLRSFVITFDANGGEGSAPEPMDVLEATEVTLPEPGELVKPGHVFGGWNTRDDGAGDNFDAPGTFVPTGDATLYANWLVTWSAVANDEMPITAIEFTFGVPVFDLTAADITIAAGTGSATAGVLSGEGMAWSLAIDVESWGDVSVSINRRGIEVGPRTVAIATMVVNDLIRIPGGTFQMGSPEGTPESNANERPVRTVTISTFHMRRFPVTQGEWYDVMGTRPSFFNGTNNSVGTTVTPTFQWRNLPVERVSWYDALVFSNRLSIARGLTPAYSIGGSTNPDNWGPVPTSSDATWNAVTIVAGSTGYRLPTEAQWEFAARGGNGSPGNFTFSGSNNAAEVAWHNANSGGRTHEVGRLRPNALGLYDMSGNVFEWVWDRFGIYPSTPQTNPTGPAAGDHRVGRGGSWFLAPEDARSAFRVSVFPGARGSNLGFRVVRP